MICDRNCFGCEKGRTQKDRLKCEGHKERANYYRRLTYKAKKERIAENNK